MSQKINAKNLTYDTSLPPFLARLRGQQASHSGPDPILASQRRPGQKRSASEEAEDAPLIVDEAGNVVEFIEGAAEEEEEKKTVQQEQEKEEEKEDDEGKEREKVAAIGASRKRKVGRVVVVGEQSDDEGAEQNNNSKKKAKARNDDARIAKASADVRRLLHQEEEDEDGSYDIAPKGDAPQNKIKGTKKKAAKKIKLSFGD